MFVAKILDEYLYSKRNNILLLYNGIFSYQVIVELSQHIRYDMPTIPSKLKEKVFSVFVELGQNVSNYSEEKVKIHGYKQVGIGIILLAEQDDIISVVSGNLANKQKINLTQERIKEINELDRGDLRRLKLKLRDDSMKNNHPSGNVGLVDVALKASSILDTRVHPVDNNKSFFIVSVDIPKD